MNWSTVEKIRRLIFFIGKAILFLPTMFLLPFFVLPVFLATNWEDDFDRRYFKSFFIDVIKFFRWEVNK